MLFKNISILDENFTIKTNMYVGTKDSKIDYVGEKMPSQDYGEVYLGENKLLMSGFFNTHSHSPMTLLRGYGENLSLSDWLNTRIFPFEDKLQGQDVYYGTLLAICEMIRFGIVSNSDMYYFCDDMVKAFDEGGMKVNISRGTTCFDDSSYYKLPAYHEAKEIFEKYHQSSDGRIKIDISLHGEYTSSEKVALEISEFCKSLNTIMHIHMSETYEEQEQCKQRHGMTPAQYFNKIGLFDNPTLAAHCVHLEGEDFDILKEKGVSVATCPKSNLKLASGFCNVPKLLNMGINTTLGTDSVASNNNLNMLEEIKTLALIHKGFYNNPTLITPKKALEIATVNGAKAQGRNNCALIKENYQADIIVLDLASPYMYPAHDLTSNLIYSACGTDVALTMVDGKVLYKDGEYKTIDLEKVIFEVTRSKERILKELGNN